MGQLPSGNQSVGFKTNQTESNESFFLLNQGGIAVTIKYDFNVKFKWKVDDSFKF